MRSADLKKKPVLIVVTTTFPRWKNDTDPPFVFELCRRLTDQFDITVHTPHYPGALAKEAIEGVKVHRYRYFLEKYEKIAGQTAILPFLKNNRGYFFILPLFIFFQWFSLLKLIIKIKPDIIHAHWLIPSGFVSTLCNIFPGGAKVVVTCHGADVFALRGTLLTKLKRWTLKRVQAITVVSKSLEKEIAKFEYFNNPIAVIPMGVNHELFHKRRSDQKLREHLGINGTFLLYVGRLTEKKGVSYLIEAVDLVIDRGYAVSLVIIGDGELKLGLEVQACSSKMGRGIQFLGALPNNKLPVYYATADIFIGPSVKSSQGDAEGFGLTFVEASLSGCLLLGSRSGGIPDIIKDKVSGLLLEPQNPNDIADKIIWAIENTKACEDMRRFSYEYCYQHFGWEITAQNYTNLLKKIITDNRCIC